MSIRVIKEKKIFILETESASYVMRADETGCLRHVYYGAKVPDDDMSYLQAERDRGFSGNPYEKKMERGYSFDTIGQEYSGRGTGDHRITSVAAEAADGGRTTDLRFDSFRVQPGVYEPEGLPYVREGGSAETLVITLKDRHSGLSAELYYTVFGDKDVIARAVKLRNDSRMPLFISKAASVCVDHEYGDLDIIHFHGRHCMERQPERIPVPSGVFSVQSDRGISSHHHNPFVILCDHNADENSGCCYGYMLMYSGSHKTEIEKDQVGTVRIVSGINDSVFRWKLMPGEEFRTPEVILSFSAEGLGKLSRNYHRIIRENVIDPKYLNAERPVLLNSWEACYMDFDEKKVLGLAEGAKDLGVEMLVLDDGWFGKRDDDLSGLGDWFVNKKKISSGLPGLVRKVNKLGLEFGIWMEPEMVSEDSDLYRAHPDWALKEPGRDPEMSRDQLPLDMSRQEVRDYLFDCISKILESADIRYIKWDINRGLDSLYSNALPEDRQGELSHRYVLGVYELLSRISKAFPDVMTEGCCGGGGRFDAGMLFYCPQIWCSDNTDAVDRLTIQRGTAYGYPLSAAGAHVSASPNGLTGRHTPLSTRAVVAMAGTFGYELDPAELSEEEKDEIRREIENYHRFSRLIREGGYYRLGDDGISSGRGGRAGAVSLMEAGWQAWEIVSEDKSEALVSLVAVRVEANAPFPLVRLAGLDPEALYSVEDVLGEGKEKAVHSGAALMNGGLRLEVMTGDYPAAQLHLSKV